MIVLIKLMLYEQKSIIDAAHAAADTEQAAQAVAETGPARPLAGIPNTAATPLRREAADILNCNSLGEVMAGMDGGNHGMGNRAFMRWVGELRARGQDGDSHAIAAGSGRARQVVCPDALPAPLQLMPKKKKKQGVTVTGALTDAGGEAVGDVMPGPGESAGTGVAAPQSEARGTLPEPEQTLPQAVSKDVAPPPGDKKKKKSRVQVALNTLRAEGVEAFKSYIEAGIGETGLLCTLVGRIKQAGDLGGVKAAALAILNARIQLLDPVAVSALAEAPAPAQSQAGEIPEIAQVKSGFNRRERELVESACTGNLNRLRRFLRHGNVDINMGYESGTLLCYAAYYGHAGIAKELLSRPGINVNLAQLAGATPLYFAAQEGHVGVVNLLLDDRRINVNLAAMDGTTPLSIAAQKGHEKVVEMLLAFPRINAGTRNEQGATVLFGAAQDGCPETVEQLVRHSVDINLPLYDGTSPLCSAARNGHIKVVSILLGTPGIQVNQATEKGVSPITIAAQYGHKDIVRLLHKKGADPNIKTAGGTTALHVACLRGHTAVIQTLLHAGADMDARMKTGKRYTAVEIAQLMNHREVMSILAAHGRRRRQAPQDEPGFVTPPATAPAEWSTRPSAMPDTHHGETASIAAVSPANPGTCLPEVDESTLAGTVAGPLSPAVPGGEPVKAGTPSPLAQAQDGLRQEVLGKLRDDNLESLEGIRLLEDINDAGDLDSLCVLYNRLAHIERRKERARRGRRRREGLPGAMGPGPVAAGQAAPVYSLGERTGLDTEAVEVEIKRHLSQAYYRFVSQAVNDMEFGRGKPTTGYPGLWHTSAGVPGVGSCSVFYYLDGAWNRIRIVGTGQHVGRAAYRLHYATEELGGAGRVLRID